MVHFTKAVVHGDDPRRGGRGGGADRQFADGGLAAGEGRIHGRQVGDQQGYDQEADGGLGEGQDGGGHIGGRAKPQGQQRGTAAGEGIAPGGDAHGPEHAG